MRTKLFLLLIILTAFLLSSCTASAEENDAEESAALRDTDIMLLSDSIGLEYSEAAEIYELLMDSGISAGIKYVTAWNDADTGEIYYRVRTDTEKREVYLYSDGDDFTVKITDGDIDYTSTETETDAEDEAEAVSETKGIITEAVSEVQETETAETIMTETEAETESVTEETVTAAEPVTETSAVTEEITEKVTEKITEAEKEKFEIVLNKNTKKYHYPGCSSIRQMKEKNKERVYVTDIDELFDMGYEPCGNCAKKDKR